MSRTLYCDDWSCPAAVSCAQHFGRSIEYALQKQVETMKFRREPGKTSCAAYAFDRPKNWLMPPPGAATVGLPR